MNPRFVRIRLQFARLTTSPSRGMKDALSRLTRGGLSTSRYGRNSAMRIFVASVASVAVFASVFNALPTSVAYSADLDQKDDVHRQSKEASQVPPKILLNPATWWNTFNWASSYRESIEDGENWKSALEERSAPGSHGKTFRKCRSKNCFPALSR